jgi:hypothetical protein
LGQQQPGLVAIARDLGVVEQQRASLVRSRVDRWSVNHGRDHMLALSRAAPVLRHFCP